MNQYMFPFYKKTEIVFCHTNSLRRILCVCQLLMVAHKLDLMNSKKPSSICATPTSSKKSKDVKPVAKKNVSKCDMAVSDLSRKPQCSAQTNISKRWTNITKYIKICTSIYKYIQEIYKIPGGGGPARPRGAGPGPARTPRGRAGPPPPGILHISGI